MQKFIIIEGPDRVGKDTQSKLLQLKLIKERLPIHMFHYSGVKGIPKEKIKEYSELMYTDMFKIMKEAYKAERSLIFNRSHIGEYIYSPMYRDYDGSYIFDIEKKFIDEEFWIHIFLIVLVDEPQNLIDRDDGDSFSISLDKKKEEIDRFTGAIRKSKIKFKKLINIKGMSIDDVHREICLATYTDRMMEGRLHE